MNLPPEVVDGSFRISLSRETTQEDVDALIGGIENILAWKNR
jgi:cysteine sulfinate desulfinase/cysteine desulfurase-like protein